MLGKVVEIRGPFYIVKNEENISYRCILKGALKYKKLNYTRLVTVGDMVNFVIYKNRTGSIINILPRINYISRKYPKNNKISQLLAANINFAILINAPIKNKFDLFNIDKFLVTIEFFNISPIIIFNKIDLLNKKNLKLLFDIMKIYKKLKYTALEMSIYKNYNIDKIKKICTNKVSLLTGNSGVGKSSLINNLLNSDKQKIKQVSSKNSKGRHTTSFSKMFSYDTNTFLIDSPGVQEIFPNEITKHNLKNYFIEFLNFKNCKYYNCMHIHESDCEVKDSIDNINIFESRYASYKKIFYLLNSN